MNRYIVGLLVLLMTSPAAAGWFSEAPSCDSKEAKQAFVAEFERKFFCYWVNCSESSYHDTMELSDADYGQVIWNAIIKGAIEGAARAGQDIAPDEVMTFIANGFKMPLGIVQNFYRQLMELKVESRRQFNEANLTFTRHYATEYDENIRRYECIAEVSANYSQLTEAVALAQLIMEIGSNIQTTVMSMASSGKLDIKSFYQNYIHMQTGMLQRKLSIAPVFNGKVAYSVQETKDGLLVVLEPRIP